MNEFTGERVIPGQVENDLWNEHFARYAFAARFARDRGVLDIGCGTGYGAAELSRSALSVIGTDLAAEAVAYARQHFPLPNLHFAAASATGLPFPDFQFSLITAFEVVEHLPDWRGLLTEAERVLAPDGLFLISTPNKHYYTESRGSEGANPFHVHEFEAEEFRAELALIFPNVVLLLQNRSEAIVFYPPQTYLDTAARIDGSGGGREDSHFFLAVCSKTALDNIKTFVYVARAANVLRERERHIAMLQHQLDETLADRTQLLTELQKQKDHLEEQNRWALGLEKAWRAAQERIVQIQNEFALEQQAGLATAAQYRLKVDELEEETAKRAEWALDTERRLTAEVEEFRSRLAEAVLRLEAADALVEERSRWVLELQAKLEHAQARISGARSSRWVRTGRMFGVGPEL